MIWYELKKKSLTTCFVLPMAFKLMDLQRTIKLLVNIFPNLEYLSLHGNPICPDELELQPFCEYVNYEYEYYR